jgi:predicted transcriptional regulator
VTWNEKQIQHNLQNQTNQTEKEIERNIKQQHQDATQELSSIASNSKKDVTENFSLFQREAFKKMKSITDASDDVCVSLLSKTGFKLNDSIELFYRGDR